MESIIYGAVPCWMFPLSLQFLKFVLVLLSILFFSLHISIFNYAPISFFVHGMCDCWGTCLHYISFLLQRFTMHIVKHYIKCIFNGWNSFYNLRGFIKFCSKIYGFVMLLRSPCRSQKWEKCVTAIIVDALFDFYYPFQSSAGFEEKFSMGFCCRCESFQIKKPKSYFGWASAFLARKKKMIVKQHNKLIKSKERFFLMSRVRIKITIQIEAIYHISIKTVTFVTQPQQESSHFMHEVIIKILKKLKKYDHPEVTIESYFTHSEIF